MSRIKVMVIAAAIATLPVLNPAPANAALVSHNAHPNGFGDAICCMIPNLPCGDDYPSC